MEQIEGSIVYNDLGYSKGLKRFTEKQVIRWLREKNNFLDFPVRYQVAFDREGQTKLVGCRVELVLDGRAWMGFDVAASADLALIRTLHRLSNVTGSSLVPPAWSLPQAFPKAG